MAMVKPASTDRILAATGMAFAEWAALLDAEGARALSHKQIADLICATGKSSGWWAQTITVAYEQHIGRRLPGQRPDGRFSASVSRTLEGEAESLFGRWCEMMVDETAILGSELKAEPSLSKTVMGHNWRCRTQDGANVVVTFIPSDGRTRVTAQHEGLAAFDSIAAAKQFWGQKFAELAR